jgi:hypothetical protein
MRHSVLNGGESAARRRLWRGLGTVLAGASLLGLGMSSPSAPQASGHERAATLAGAAAPAADRSALPVRRAVLDEVVDELVRTMPGRATEGYRRPTAAEVSAMGGVVSQIGAGRVEAAARAAEPLGYRVVHLVDALDRRRYVLLDERGAGTARRGWGTYVIAVRPRLDLLVEVSHPRFDIDTPQVGVGVFRATGARALLVAGAHRYANADGSADVAHAPVSIFEAVHEGLVRRGTVVYQPHGFSQEKHPNLGDVVVSASEAPATPLAVALAGGLARLADVCLYDGTRCRALAGTTNVQARSTRAAGGSFLHVELSRPLRSDTAERAGVVSLTASVLERRSRAM